MSVKNSLKNKTIRREQRKVNAEIQANKQAAYQEMIRLFTEPPTGEVEEEDQSD